MLWCSSHQFIMSRSFVLQTKTLDCLCCNQNFRSQYRLDKHMSECHKLCVVSSPTPPARSYFLCERCGKLHFSLDECLCHTFGCQEKYLHLEWEEQEEVELLEPSDLARGEPAPAVVEDEPNSTANNAQGDSVSTSVTINTITIGIQTDPGVWYPQESAHLKWCALSECD